MKNMSATPGRDTTANTREATESEEEVEGSDGASARAPRGSSRPPGRFSAPDPRPTPTPEPERFATSSESHERIVAVAVDVPSTSRGDISASSVSNRRSRSDARSSSEYFADAPSDAPSLASRFRASDSAGVKSKPRDTPALTVRSAAKATNARRRRQRRAT